MIDIGNDRPLGDRQARAAAAVQKLRIPETVPILHRGEKLQNTVTAKYLQPALRVGHRQAKTELHIPAVDHGSEKPQGAGERPGKNPSANHDIRSAATHPFEHRCDASIAVHVYSDIPHDIAPGRPDVAGDRTAMTMITLEVDGRGRDSLGVHPVDAPA